MARRTENVTFQQRFEGNEGIDYQIAWEESQCKLRDGEEVSMTASSEQGTDEQVQADCVGHRLSVPGSMAAYQSCKMEGSRRVENRG